MAREPNPWIRVRNSSIHGRGVFAKTRIPKGTRIIEYVGDRVSHAEADQRYEHCDPNDNHTFLFVVDRKTVIDAEIGGNAARFINHCCDGNCESVIEGGRVFIEATRVIQKDDELGYDYEIGREKDDPPNVDEIFACRCGSAKCRGTMLWPAKRPAAKSKAKASARRNGKTKVKGKPKTRRKPKTRGPVKVRASQRGRVRASAR